jgi:REP element-mobilizing transposase RayT
MPYVKIWIHCVWGTKKRFPFLVTEKRKKIIDHIISNAKEKNICIDTLNGYTNHLHCLISLGATQTLADVLRLIKGEPSQKENLGRGRK